MTGQAQASRSGGWWVDVRHLLVGSALGAAGYGLFLVTLTAAALSLVAGLGVPLFVWSVDRVRRLADAQRARVHEPVARPYRPVPATASVADRALLMARDPATWRDLAWCALPVQLSLGVLAVGLVLSGLQGLAMPWLWELGDPTVYNGVTVADERTAVLVMAIGVLVLLASERAPGLLRALEDGWTRRLLGPVASAQLAARVEQLTETRAEAVDASAVELRRIERDLHDGAQARLVALAMSLGLAEDLVLRDPQAAKALIADARSTANDAMTELRGLVRGIHPPMLADRGLGGALQALALASPVPVALDLGLERRLAPPLESAAYFTMVEALTNAVKHSGARLVTLTVADLGEAVGLRVLDDGRGGADASLGTGLRGIERRLAAFDGTLRVSSPAGGPTLVEAVLPCAS